MKKLILTLIVVASATVSAQDLKSYTEKMTYGQCKQDSNIRALAAEYRQKYPSTSIGQILDILCKNAR